MTTAPSPRPRSSSPSVLIGLGVAIVVVIALVGIALVAGPFGADGDSAAGGGQRATGLRAQTERNGDRTRVSITGRVRPSDGRGPAVVHVLVPRDAPGPRRDAAAGCPNPVVGVTGSITPPAGAVPVRWDPDAGPRPGEILPVGQPIRMVGDVDGTVGRARRLCVHLVRGGSRAQVLRSVAVATPDASATSGPGVETPLQEDAIVLGLLAVIVGAIVLGALAIAVVEADRRGQEWALPALPADVRVPDVVPVEDPLKGLPRHRRIVLAIGARREGRWRAKRRAAAEAAGEPYDRHERPPWHVAMWGVGDGAGRIAVERFRALRDLYPEVDVRHHRRVPGPRGATIDHVFVGPAGVVVASSSRWEGFVEVRGERLVVAGRDRTRAIDGVLGRVAAVRANLEAAGYAGVPVQGVLHCVQTKDVLLNGSLSVRGVPLLDAVGTLDRASGVEMLGHEDVRRIVVALERRLPRAG